MALYVGNTLIPQQKGKIKVNGTNITKVICNGVTVWLADLTTYLYRSGGGIFVPGRYKANNSDNGEIADPNLTNGDNWMMRFQLNNVNGSIGKEYCGYYASAFDVTDYTQVHLEYQCTASSNSTQSGAHTHMYLYFTKSIGNNYTPTWSKQVCGTTPTTQSSIDIARNTVVYDISSVIGTQYFVMKIGACYGLMDFWAINIWLT